LVAYCAKGHINVIALITDAEAYQSGGSRIWKVTCRTCLAALEIPEYDLKAEHVFDEDLDRDYGKQTLPTLP
jgi:hypothetical protein